MTLFGPISADVRHMIDDPPKVMLLTVDLDEHLIQMPASPAGHHPLNPSLSDLGRKHRAETDATSISPLHG